MKSSITREIESTLLIQVGDEPPRPATPADLASFGFYPAAYATAAPQAAAPQAAQETPPQNESKSKREGISDYIKEEVLKNPALVMQLLKTLAANQQNTTSTVSTDGSDRPQQAQNNSQQQNPLSGLLDQDVVNFFSNTVESIIGGVTNRSK